MARTPTAATATERIADLQKQRAKLLADQVAAKRAKDPEALRLANAALASWTENLRLNEEIAEQERLDAEADEKRQHVAHAESSVKAAREALSEGRRLGKEADAALLVAYDKIDAIRAQAEVMGRALRAIDPSFDHSGFGMMLIDVLRQRVVDHGFVSGLKNRPDMGAPTIESVTKIWQGRLEGVARLGLQRIRRECGLQS